MVLEFVSTQPPPEARSFLGELAPLLNELSMPCSNAAVLTAFSPPGLELGGEEAHAVQLTPDEALDTAWEEPAVFAGCSTKGQVGASPAQSIHFVKNDAARPGASGGASTGAST